MPRNPRLGTCADRICDKPESIAIRTTNDRSKDGLVHTIYSVASDAPSTVPGYCVEHAASLAAKLAVIHEHVKVTTTVTKA